MALEPVGLILPNPSLVGRFFHTDSHSSILLVMALPPKRTPTSSDAQ
jgi:hypothetical protein